MLLHLRVRPKSFEAIVAHDKWRKLLIARRDSGMIGGAAYYITGPSGVGKGCFADCIAGAVADKFHITETTGAQLTVKDCEDWFGKSGYSVLSATREAKTGRALIVNESHGLKPNVVAVLLQYLEKGLGENEVFVATTTVSGDEAFENRLDAKPFRDRCLQIELSGQGLCKPFAAYLREVAQQFNLDGKPIAAYERFMKDRVSGNSLREALGRLENGAMLD